MGYCPSAGVNSQTAACVNEGKNLLEKETQELACMISSFHGGCLVSV